ncbi:MAG: AmmeMemoRadiSam system protein B, partial [Pseudomonadota bacterium]
MSIHQAKFAGSFYTSEPVPLNRQVRLLIQGAKIRGHRTAAQPMAIVAPHAGYRFCGDLIGEAYGAALRPDMTHSYTRVVVLSPSHKHRFDGLAIPSWSTHALPNGRVRLDGFLCNQLLDRDLVQVNDAAHENEHGIETQLPFLARYFQKASILPVVCGRIPVVKVAELVDFLASDGDHETLFVLSSDLSHFHAQDVARQLDADTARMIETADVQALNSTQACGWMPLAGFLSSKTGAGARALRLGMSDSAGVTGDTGRVVGYGAWAFFPQAAEVISPAQRDEALRVARRALRSHLHRGKPPAIEMKTFAPAFQTHMASFVTLTYRNRLRGCIGSLQAHQPLIQDIALNAIKAGTKDHRFKPLTQPAELDALDLKIALLTRPAPMRFSSREDLEAQLVPGETGLILRSGQNAGTFLPMVWDSIDTPRKFID